jgi:phosphatidate cytidylyltransferase
MTFTMRILNQKWLIGIASLIFAIVILKFALSWFFIVFLSIICAICAREFCDIMKINRRWYFIVSSVALMLSGLFDLIDAALFLVIGIYCALTLRGWRTPSDTADLAFAVLGFFIIGYSMSYWIALRAQTNGPSIAATLFVWASASNITAQVFGRFWKSGVPITQASPNKKIFPTIAAIIPAALISYAGADLLNYEIHLSTFLMLFPVIWLCVRIGDLTESMIKRYADVADSGGILGRHGGMLDAMDSFWFSAPVMYYAASYALGGAL